jgi:fatty-acyl-CoA synthase
VNCLASHLREAHFGVPAAGGVLVADNTGLNSQEIDYFLNHSGVKFLFVDAELAPLVEPLHLEGIQVVRIDDTGSAEDAYEAFLTDGSPEPATNWLEDECSTVMAGVSPGL